MSKAPDLSAFPIPRKGGARPIMDDASRGPGEGQGRRQFLSQPRHPNARRHRGARAPLPHSRPAPRRERRRRASLARSNPLAHQPPPPPTYGQTVATTVKLDENRYLRLMEAGKPGPGRLRRRTIQDMLIEALDEWFERRQL